MTVKEMFDAADNEFLKFDRIKNPRHPRPDICAFLMLHELVPGTKDMVTGARHDEISLSVTAYELEGCLTPEIAVDLHRCGVRYSEEWDCLAMFV